MPISTHDQREWPREAGVPVMRDFRVMGWEAAARAAST